MAVMDAGSSPLCVPGGILKGRKSWRVAVTSCWEAIWRASSAASMSPARIAACMVLISRDSRAASACASCSLGPRQDAFMSAGTIECSVPLHSRPTTHNWNGTAQSCPARAQLYMAMVWVLAWLLCSSRERSSALVYQTRQQCRSEGDRWAGCGLVPPQLLRHASQLRDHAVHPHIPGTVRHGRLVRACEMQKNPGPTTHQIQSYDRERLGYVSC